MKPKETKDEEDINKQQNIANQVKHKIKHYLKQNRNKNME